MVELLRDVGVDEGELAEADRRGHLPLLVVEHLVLAEPATHDLDGMADATGLTPELITRVWRSLGFVEPRPGDHIFTDVDVDLLCTIGHLLELGVIDDELVLQMSRVIGSSLARVAAALVDAIEPTDEGPVDDRAAGLLASALPDDREPTGFADVAPVLFPTLLQVMEFVWRRHVQAVARARISREQAGADPDHLVVGFADLVGFTALSQQVGTHELAAVVERFETIAYDTVTGLGGRVVKMIGDEVMFAVPHERAAAEIALSLSQTYRDDDELSDVRVGLAAGPVLQREADLYGPVVNRASRIVGIAFPGTVVCAAEVHHALESDVEFAWKAIGTRNLKDIGRVPLWVLRRTGDEVAPRTTRQEAEARRAERREARLAQMQAGGAAKRRRSR
jgi:adenylate cyclase